MSEITLTQLKSALEKVPGTYPDFVESELHIAKKAPRNLIMLWEYILNNPKANSSDIILFTTRNIKCIQPINIDFVERYDDLYYLTVYDDKNRTIKLGLFLPERYNEKDNKESDHWWLVHLYINTSIVKYDMAMESMLQCELIDLAERIEKSKFISGEERVSFMEQEYEFILSSQHGYLVINDTSCDSINLWLSRQELDSISCYIRDRIAKSEEENKRS
ncbi:hypothetical protein [Ruminococcus albus]|uniref:Uncharacterized protein n=1 Tax=Ruminococcus albus TaxID=1264 RepID=A0A1I1P3T7_RUMAL|nr:hypothetical protein [Ruminococcus albus]SFD04601.1 hypothetical protein SAMN02910406_02951 [Ruminococcus albus]